MVFPGDVGESPYEFLARIFLLRQVRIGEFLDRVDRRLLKRLIGHGSARESDNRESPCQAILRRKSVERGNQLAPGKVAGSAEDNDGAGISRQDGTFLG